MPLEQHTIPLSRVTLEPDFDRAMKTLLNKNAHIRQVDGALFGLMELWRHQKLSGLEKDRAIEFFYKADQGLISIGPGLRKAIRWEAPVELRNDLRKYASVIEEGRK